MGNKVRIGMIGLGARGKGLLETAYLEHPDAEFVEYAINMKTDVRKLRK